MLCLFLRYHHFVAASVPCINAVSLEYTLKLLHLGFPYPIIRNFSLLTRIDLLDSLNMRALLLLLHAIEMLSFNFLVGRASAHWFDSKVVLVRLVLTAMAIVHNSLSTFQLFIHHLDLVSAVFGLLV
mgnify:CR=1 FL=1